MNYMFSGIKTHDKLYLLLQIGTSKVLQSNHVDSSGLEATPPHAWEESETKSKAKLIQTGKMLYFKHCI
jgi:hypothetical protein